VKGGSGHCGLLRPPELCAVGPDASQDHSYLARDGNLGLFLIVSQLELFSEILPALKGEGSERVFKRPAVWFLLHCAASTVPPTGFNAPSARRRIFTAALLSALASCPHPTQTNCAWSRRLAASTKLPAEQVWLV